jgi:hydroxymethylpyrimidine pyrophosphatase-like HAD family hydrolase
VLGCADVAQVADVGRHGPALPPGAAQEEARPRQGLGGGEEELVDPRLAVGQPVAEEAELGRETKTKVVVSDMVAQASEPEYVTLTPRGVDKGSGTAKLLADYIIPPGHLFVLGDGENDLPLFALCGVTRFAVGAQNAVLAAQADHIVPGIDQDGFWWAVKYVIIPVLDGKDGS